MFCFFSDIKTFLAPDSHTQMFLTVGADQRGSRQMNNHEITEKWTHIDICEQLVVLAKSKYGQSCCFAQFSCKTVLDLCVFLSVFRKAVIFE